MARQLGTNTPYGVGDVLNAVYGEHGTAADGNPVFLPGGAKYVVTPTANADGDYVVAWGDAYGYPTPHREAVLLHSVTTAGSGASSTGTALTGLGAFKNMSVVVVTSLATGAAATLNVFVDSRLDGTNWTNLARLTAITAIGSAVANLTKEQAAGEVVVSADAGAGTVRLVGWGSDVRIRTTVEGTATTSVTATMYVNVTG